MLITVHHCAVIEYKIISAKAVFGENNYARGG